MIDDPNSVQEGIPRELADGKYRLLNFIGQGGAGVVYRAQGPQGLCAVKLRLVPEEKIRAARFLVEPIPMAKVKHPRIIRVHDTGRDEGYYWIAMDLYEQGTLADRVIEQGPLPVDEGLAIAEQILEGLQVLHDEGFIHRDIKPQNIFIDSDGGIVIGDFGVARHLHTSLWFRTGTGHSLGTMGYRAPEQDGDAKGAGPPADVYGVAAVLYFLFTGGRPPLLYASKMRPEVLDPIPGCLREVMQKATAHDPVQRYPTATAFRAAIHDVRNRWRNDHGLEPLAPLQKSWLQRIVGSLVT